MGNRPRRRRAWRLHAPCEMPRGVEVRRPGSRRTFQRMAVLLHAGYTVVVAADDGSVRDLGREGVYDFDARLFSRFGYRLGDEELRLVGASQPGPHRWSARLVAASPARSRNIRGPGLPQD